MYKNKADHRYPMKINATEVAKMTNMKWIATLILLIVSLAPLAVAEENQTDTGSSDTGSDEKTDDSVDAVDIADKIVVSRREMVKDRVQEVRDGVKGMREEAQKAREIRAGLKIFAPKPPKICLPIKIAKTEPRMAAYQVVDGGKIKDTNTS